MVMRAIAGLLISATLVTAASNQAAANEGSAPPNATISYFPADAARGKTLAAGCITCHGIAGMKLGNPPFSVPLLGGQRPEVIFAALRDYKSGARANDIMAPMAAGLALQDMRDLGAYLSSSGPILPGTHDEGGWAQQKVRRDCSACHGEGGMSMMPGVPVLTGQHEDYLVYALNAYSSGARKDPTMGPIAARLKPDEVAQLAAYFAKQQHLELSK
jgi:cytochrome c553